MNVTYVVTKTLTIEDVDPSQAVFTDPQAVPWEPVEGEQDFQADDVTVTLDGNTFERMGSPVDITVQITPRKELKG